MPCPSTTGCADDCATCIHNDSTLQSRYEKLKSISLDMLAEIEDCEDEGSWWHHHSEFRDKLKELGVIVDGS